VNAHTLAPNAGGDLLAATRSHDTTRVKVDALVGGQAWEASIQKMTMSTVTTQTTEWMV
jgi:hypothetical protein